jgi:hypothetical protein
MGMMESRRILELALEELLRKKVELDQEIETLTSELEGQVAIRQTRPVAPSAGPQRGRKRTAAEKKAHSTLMKKVWAARRAKAAKPATETKAAPRAKAQVKKNARSEAMKAAWKKRKAAAAAKIKTVKAPSPDTKP